MEVSMIRKCVVMMLMIMLIVTHVESNSPSQKFGTTKFKGLSRATCEIKCTMTCLPHIIHDYEACVVDCENKNCYSNTNWFKLRDLQQ